MVKWTGLLVVISSPSGGGKTTIIRRILGKGLPNVEYSVSVTTRPPRHGETNGRDYFFVTTDDFKNKIEKSELIEWEEVHGCYYGTPKDLIEEWLQQGKTVLMDIDVKGALTIGAKYPQHSLLIFLKPPSKEVLIERLLSRDLDNQKEIYKRLKAAEEEMAISNKFDHIVINDELNQAVEEVWGLVKQYNYSLEFFSSNR